MLHRECARAQLLDQLRLPEVSNEMYTEVPLRSDPVASPHFLPPST
jgi:hypothetical protein